MSQTQQRISSPPTDIGYRSNLTESEDEQTDEQTDEVEQKHSQKQMQSSQHSSQQKMYKEAQNAVTRERPKATKAPRNPLATGTAKKSLKKHKTGKKGKSVAALRDIKKYQKSTDLLANKTAFRRVIREIVQDSGSKNQYRIQPDAFLALQESAEHFIVNLLGDANAFAIHAGRVTVFPKDLKLATKYIN